MRWEDSLFIWFRKRLLKSAHWVLIGSLFFSSADLKHEVLAVPASGSVTAASPTQGVNNCLTQATAQINSVRYVGKNSSGNDEVEVNWC